MCSRLVSFSAKRAQHFDVSQDGSLESSEDSGSVRLRGRKRGAPARQGPSEAFITTSESDSGSNHRPYHGHLANSVTAYSPLWRHWTHSASQARMGPEDFVKGRRNQASCPNPEDDAATYDRGRSRFDPRRLSGKSSGNSGSHGGDGGVDCPKTRSRIQEDKSLAETSEGGGQPSRTFRQALNAGQAINRQLDEDIGMQVHSEDIALFLSSTANSNL
jgi:hypothetical protein